MKLWQYLIVHGLYVLGFFFIFASLGALISYKIMDLIMFGLLGITTIILGEFIKAYFNENSTEKILMIELDLN